MSDLLTRIVRLEGDQPEPREPRSAILERINNRLDAIRARLGRPEPTEDEVEATLEAGRQHLAAIRERMRR